MFKVRNTGRLTSTRKTDPGFLKAVYPKSSTKTDTMTSTNQPVLDLAYKTITIEGVSTDNNGVEKFGNYTLNGDSTIVSMYSRDNLGNWGGQSSWYGVQVNSVIDGSSNNVGTKYYYSIEFPNVPDNTGTYIKYPQGSGNLFIGNNGLNIFTNGFVLHFEVNTNGSNQSRVFSKQEEKITFDGWTKYIEIEVKSNNILSARGFTDASFTDLKWTIPQLFAIYGDEPENMSVMTVIPASNYTTGWTETETVALRTMEFGILEISESNKP